MYAEIDTVVTLTQTATTRCERDYENIFGLKNNAVVSDYIKYNYLLKL